MENANKKLKKTETTLNATDIKLNRALEDLRKQKDSSSKISKSTTSISNLPSNHNLSTNEIVKIREDLKIAEKQKLNLTLLIKKQAQLIDVLKRQKLHLEAAKVLELTEKDFTKCLELSK